MAAGDEPRPKSLLDEILGRSEPPAASPGRTGNADVDREMRRIDDMLSRQLGAIMHHPKFLELEASWRGVQYLVDNAEPSESLALKLAHATKKELSADFAGHEYLDESWLYGCCHDEGLQAASPAPFLAVIADYEFSHRAADIELLTALATVAQESLTVFAAGAACELTGAQDWQALPQTNVEKATRTPDYIKWRAFRDLDAASCVALYVPPVRFDVPVEERSELSFINIPPLPALTNCAYAWGVRLLRSLQDTNWPANIRGIEGGGRVEDLRPPHSDNRTDTTLHPVAVAIQDSQHGVLEKHGLSPLCKYKNTDDFVFLGGATCRRPQQFDNPGLTAKAAILARLPMILSINAILHNLLATANASVEKRDPKKLELQLNRWISQFTDASRSDPVGVPCPLDMGKVSVAKAPDAPGYWMLQVELRPLVPLEELSSPFRVTVPLALEG